MLCSHCGMNTGNIVYVAPETIIAMGDTSVALNRKIDVFALGLLFHQYYSGRLPEGYMHAVDAVVDKKDGPECERFYLARRTDYSEAASEPEKRPETAVVFQCPQEQQKPMEKKTTAKSFLRRPMLKDIKQKDKAT